MSEKNITKAALSPYETIETIADALHDRSILSNKSSRKFDKAAVNTSDPSGVQTKK